MLFLAKKKKIILGKRKVGNILILK
uniref:Uncharacterized protein n=1 Tax=Arundo donax TaxID=35708 RepID=A0A0A9BZV4_ARUDO